MIVFSLKCPADHVFEGWFRDNAAFDAQAASGDISCAVCGDTEIVKAPMAPKILRGSAEPKLDAAPVKAALRAIRAEVEANCDYVGPNFAEEAKRIHFGEVEPHAIYGEATQEEASDLADIGVDIAKLPWIEPEN